MAKFGAKYPCFAPFASEPENAHPTYGTGVRIGKLVAANLTVNLASGELYADDELSEQLSEFASGTLPMETDDILDNVAGVVYGAAVAGQKVTYNKGNTPPYGGLAYYKSLLRNGIPYFQGYYYPKVRAALGNDNAQTRGNSITFATTTTNFTVFTDNLGDWRITETFTTEAAARAWVEAQLGMTTAYEITIAKSGAGTVTPLGTLYVETGGNLSITITGTATALYDNGEDETASISSGVYALSNITADHEIVVVF